jgi:hypothetical protein
MPDCTGDVCDAVEHQTDEMRAQTVGPALAAWVQASRDSAYATSQPIPALVRNRMRGFVSEEILDRARYKVGDNGFFNLGSITVQYGDYLPNNDPQAIVLIDVIVFADESLLSDLGLWAHELYHVQQYAEWGVFDFSLRYARNASAVEEPAYAEGERYNALAATGRWGAPMPTGFPITEPNTSCGGAMHCAAFCVTAVGRFGPGIMQPVGTPCTVTPPPQFQPVHGYVGN